MIISWLDGLGLLVLGYNVMRGATTGLIRTSLSAIAVVSASTLAWKYQNLAAPLIDPFLPVSVPFAFLIHPLVIWIAVFVSVNLLGVVLRRAVSLTPLVVADRIGGAVFGLAIGLSIFMIPLVLVASFPLLQQFPAVQQALGSSVLANTLSPVVPIVMKVAPQAPLL